MRKMTFIVSLFVSLMLTPLAMAQGWKSNEVTNRTNKTVYLVFSTWRPARSPLPEGYRITGHYRLRPNQTHEFYALNNNAFYLQVWHPDLEVIKPTATVETFSAPIITDPFEIVLQRQISFAFRTNTILYRQPSGNYPLEHGFLRYQNTGTPINITNAWVNVDVGADGMDGGDDAGDPRVNMPDPNLYVAIRETLGITSGTTISQADMLRLTEFYAYEIDIKNLTGIEFATNLRELYLSDNDISDVSPLARLTNLRELHLSDNDISDVSPLARLTNLRELDLTNNDISDVSPLARLTNLTHLHLDRNRISDISPLARLTNLIRLTLDRNQISDFSPIAGLIPNLKTYGKSNQGVPVEDDVGDTGGIISDPNLYVAIRENLGKTPGATISQADMLRLTELDAWEIGIKNLTGIEFATNLRELHLSDNDISDVSPLARLTNLTHLSLEYNRISDISPLAGLTNLIRLDLDDNQISDFSPIAGLIPNLRNYGKSNQDVPVDDGGDMMSDGGADTQQPDSQQQQWTGSVTITAPSTVEPKAGSFSGNIPISFNLTASSGQTVNGKRLHMSTSHSGSVSSNFDSTTLTTNASGKASTTLRLRNNSTGSIEITAIVDGSDVRASKTITVKQTLLSWRNTTIPTVLISGKKKDITFATYSNNGTRMPGVEIRILEPDDAEISFSPLSGVTGSSGLWKTTMYTGSQGSANFRVKVGHIPVSEFFNLTVKPAIVYEERWNKFEAECRNRGWMERTVALKFPGRIISYEIDISGSDAIMFRDDFELHSHRKTSSNTVTVRFSVWEDDCRNRWRRRNWANVTVGAKCEVTAPLRLVNGAPSLHPQAYEQDLSLVAAHPRMQLPSENALLPNYPNPFNPETWIPYQLAKPADVTLTIYAVNGKVVWRLVLGHQLAGVYQSRSRAAYWDGRNALGEPVASGIYFYTLTAGDFSATKKMLIRK